MKGAFTSPQTPTKIRRSICVTRPSLRLIERASECVCVCVCCASVRSRALCRLYMCTSEPLGAPVQVRTRSSLFLCVCVCVCVCEWFCAYAITHL